MRGTAAFPEWVLVAGMVCAAALAAGAVLGRTVRGRAWAMLGALVLTPVVLVAEIWDSPQIESVRSQGLVGLAAAAVGLAAMAALAWLFARRPGFLAVLALAALPFRIPVQAGGSTANLLVPLYVVIGAGALAWLVPRLSARYQGEPAEQRNGGLEWVLMGGIVLYAVQAVYADDSAKALEQVVFFYVPFALLFALLRALEWTPRRLAWGGGVLVALALVFAGIGFWEFQTRSLLLNPKVIASNQVEEYFRVNSLFFDPNIYGRFLALVMIGLATVLVWAKRPRNLALTIAALAVLWGGLITTLSQSSFAALLLGLFVLAWLRFGGKVVFLPTVAAAVIAAVLVFAFPSALRLELNSDSLDRATSGRVDLMRGGVELARERPLGGWGSGSFEDEYRRQERSSAREATNASHTIPITVAAEQGVIGLAAYAALLALALRRLLRNARRAPVRAAIAAGFAALVLHTWLYAAFLEDPFTWTLLAVGTALAIAPAARREPATDEAASRNGHRPEAAVVARSTT
ncbi:MAG TPA: O-antigen ligase family protein [Solirubrobacter sp.]|nr:O-antigen ligase family protein [Solirubrobacter sp.]